MKLNFSLSLFQTVRPSGATLAPDMSLALMFAPTSRALFEKEAIPTLEPFISGESNQFSSYLEVVEQQREQLMSEKDYYVRERRGLTLLRGDWRLAWVQSATHADEIERARLYARCRHEEGLVFLSIANGFATSPNLDECYGKRREFLARAAEAFQSSIELDPTAQYQFSLGLVYKWLGLNWDALQMFEKAASSIDDLYSVKAHKEIDRLGHVDAPIEEISFDSDEPTDEEVLSPTQEFLKRLINERGFLK